MTNTTCTVSGCDNPREEVFEIHPAGVRLDYGVCHTHGAALKAGDFFEVVDVNDEDDGLRMGLDTLPQVINFQVSKDGISEPVVTLMLGRDGVESQRVEFHISRDKAADLARWI